MEFTKDSILINPGQEAQRITSRLKEDIALKLKKRGAVIGVSGGVDSSVVLALCVHALGAERVLALLLPEKESSSDNIGLVKMLFEKYKVKHITEDITGALDGFSCYRRRNEAIKRVFPEFNESYKAKIVLPEIDSDKEHLNIFNLKIISPDGEEKIKRIPIKEYLEIVAASNFKQRSRMSMLYFHAEANNYAVIGTANKNEHEQGFFVKYGDSGADIKPILHLFKTQVYQLAEYLDIPAEIRSRVPTSDTYSAEQTQEEFFFRVPFEVLDRVWYGMDKNVSSSGIAQALGIDEKKVNYIISDIKRKIKTTEYLRMNPLSNILEPE
jgi:NAD+ synthase